MLTTIETQLFLLRKLEEQDALNLSIIRSDDEVNKYIDRAKHTNVAQAVDFIRIINTKVDNNETCYWAIQPKNSIDLIGTVCLFNFTHNKLTAEIGFELMPVFHNKGIMNEVVKYVVAFCFKELNLQKISAYTYAKNLACIGLLQKNNFIRNKKIDIVTENGVKLDCYCLINNKPSLI
jgi:[ribosomal protein S5]-alanine N-acetyltransferase